MLTYQTEMNNALTYAFSNRDLARKCARSALVVARALGNPALIYDANELLGWL